MMQAAADALGLKLVDEDVIDNQIRHVEVANIQALIFSE